MIFRLYLPLYSLLKQTDNATAVQSEIKKLLMDEKASSFVRKLMRDVALEGPQYNQVIAAFLANPANIANNKALRQLEAALELTINTVAPVVKAPLIDEEAPKPVTALDEVIVELAQSQTDLLKKEDN